MVVGGSLGEFVVGDGFVAAGAVPADSESGHEGAAVGAALLAELSGVAVGALVDGEGAALPGWRHDRCGGGVGLVAATPQGLAAGVGACEACSSRWERGVTHSAGCRYVTVTRRHGRCLGWWWRSG